VHELKGAAANLSAKATLTAALQLEKRAEEGDAPAVRRALDNLEAALEALNQFIRSKQWASKP